MEIFANIKDRKEEKPRDLWKCVDRDKYQVKQLTLPLTLIIEFLQI